MKNVFKGALALVAVALPSLDLAAEPLKAACCAACGGKIPKTTELDNGFVLQLPSNPETFLEVAEWVSLERPPP